MIVRSWEVSRGRSYELDKNSPGTASIEIVDLTGELDPTNSTYAFDPGTPVAITLDAPTGASGVVFRGNIAAVNYDLYPTEEYAIATVECVDGLDRLARTEMYAGQGQILEWGDYAFVSTAQDGDIQFDEDDQVAHRINQVLDQAEWPLSLREIFSGNVRLQEEVYTYRTPCLNAILDAVDAEFPGVANFYCQKTGEATFHGRLARFNPEDAQYHISIWRCGDLAAVAADSTRAPIHGLDYSLDASKILNSVIATPKGIADADIEDQRVENAASISTYGSRSESFYDLLTLEDHFDGSDANDATKKVATYYVSNYKDPRVRVNTLRFKGQDAGTLGADRLWTLMCGVDISDIIRLKTTHMGGGFDEDFYVEGIRITKGPAEVDVEMELDLSPRAYFNTNPWS